MPGIINPLLRPGQIWKALVFILVLASLIAAPAAPVGAYTGSDPDSGTDASDYAASMVSDLFPGKIGSAPQDLTVLGAAVFFSAAGDNTGAELWMALPPYTDEILVADINPGDDSSFPADLTVHGTSLFFTADDGEHGRELWVSEPPFNSARIVSDINPGRESSNPHQLTPIGTALLFAADDGSHGIELWKTQDPFHTAELVDDIFVGSPSAKPDELTLIGWNLFFSATNGSYREVWKSPPPYVNAVQVSEVNSEGPADPQDLTPVGEKLFFSALDPVYGHVLWLSELPYNPVTTRPLNNFSACRKAEPTEEDLKFCWPNYSPTDLYAIGDTLFFTGNINLIGFELWKTVPPYDPTTTNRVADLNKGYFQSSFPANKTSIDATLFFTAYTPLEGVELWRSEPPYDGDFTFEVADINKGAASSNPEQLTPAFRTLFFTATNGIDGREIWMSEPPYTKATMVQDVWLGAGSSNPTDLTSMGELLFFTAKTPGDGLELWKVLTGYWLPNTGFAPGIVTPLMKQPAAKAYQDTDMQLELPRLGMKTSIAGVPALSDGWDLAWLGNKAGYLEGTAFPTWTGNTVLTGHAYLQNGLPGPFAQLENLRYGDQVVISAWGERYVYEVRSTEQVSPQNMDAFQHEDLDWLTLITCKGWDEATNQYRARIVVRAVRVRIE